MWCSSTTRRGCWNAARYAGGISWAPGQGRRLEDPQGGEATGRPRLVTLRVDSTPPDLTPAPGASPSDCRRRQTAGGGRAPPPLVRHTATGRDRTNGAGDRSSPAVTTPLVQAAGQPADAEGGPSPSGAAREAAPRSSAKQGPDPARGGRAGGSTPAAGHRHGLHVDPGHGQRSDGSSRVRSARIRRPAAARCATAGAQRTPATGRGSGPGRAGSRGLRRGPAAGRAGRGR